MHPCHRIDIRIRQRIRPQIRRIRIRPDPSLIVKYPRAHGIVRRARIAILDPDRRRHEIAPPLAHTARLQRAQTPAVGTAARQPVRQPVRVLVHHDAGLERAVAAGRRLRPQVHAHAAWAAVGRRGEIGVVGAGAVLGVEDDVVAARAAEALVGDLEVVGGLGEAEGVQQVVVLVRGVEELRDRGVVIGCWVGDAGVVGVFEGVGVRGWAVVVEVACVGVGAAVRLWVDVCQAVVAAGRGVIASAVIVPGEWRRGYVPGVGDALAGDIECNGLVWVVYGPGTGPWSVLSTSCN